jgi:hypothetical protein
METSKEIIDRAKKRFKELEHKNYDWKSFYTGFLEAAMQVKKYDSLDSVCVQTGLECGFPCHSNCTACGGRDKT